MKNESLNWKLLLFTIYDKIHSLRIQEMLQSKVGMKDKTNGGGIRLKFKHICSICHGKSKINYFLMLQ